MKLTSIAALTATAIFASTLVNAQGPTPILNVDPSRHPNLAEAQELARKAFLKIEDGRRAHDWDKGEHLAKAENLLLEVNREISAAVNR